jgi:hypothetical protein
MTPCSLVESDLPEFEGSSKSIDCGFLGYDTVQSGREYQSLKESDASVFMVTVVISEKMTASYINIKSQFTNFCDTMNSILLEGSLSWEILTPKMQLCKLIRWNNNSIIPCSHGL